MQALKKIQDIAFGLGFLILCVGVTALAAFFAIKFTLGFTPFSQLLLGVVIYLAVLVFIYFYKPETLPVFKTLFTPLFKRTIVILIIMMLIIGFIGANYPQFLPKPPTLPQDVAGRILFILLAAILAPLMEEALFRGFLHKLLYDAYGKWVAITLCSIGFGLAHGLNPIKFAQTFIMGFCFGLLREESGSLRPSILLHFVNNAIASLFLIFTWIYSL